MPHSTLLVWIIPSTLAGGILSALSASLLMLFPQRFRDALLARLVSFAIGAMLGAAFLDLLPEAFRSEGAGNTTLVGLISALGILGFFMLEKVVFWHHAHEAQEEVVHYDQLRRRSAGTLIVIGTSLHNFLDGILLGTAFLSSVHFGVVLMVAVIAHQIPQQVGDISVLLFAGVRRRRALLLSALSGAAMTCGGILAWLLLSRAGALMPYLLAVAATSLIYIAAADLIPTLRQHEKSRVPVLSIALVISGIGLIYWIQSLLGG